MRTILKVSLFILATFSLLSCAATQRTGHSSVADQRGPRVSFNVFYESLSPYGQWINYSNYGRAWIPNVNRGFSPYATNGHWVYSTYGWTWVSHYNWGWAPFHYGRWTFDDYYGWIWIPGEVWAPAWVAWRNSSSYFGWAPLGPGVQININIGIPASRWVFVPRQYITSRNIHRYFRPRQQNIVIIRNTTIINNYGQYDNQRYNAGPTRRAVQQSTNQNVRPVRVMNSQNPEESRLSNNQLRMYRPAITHASGGREVASSHGDNRPQRVVRSSETEDRNNSRERNNSMNRPTRTARPEGRQSAAEPARRNNNRVQQQNNGKRARPVHTRPSERTPARRQAAPARQESRQSRPVREVRRPSASRSRPTNRSSARPVRTRPSEHTLARQQAAPARQESRQSRPVREVRRPSASRSRPTNRSSARPARSVHSNNAQARTSSESNRRSSSSGPQRR